MKNNIIKRFFYFCLGVFIASLGTSLVTKASLGSPQIASPAYVFSLRFKDISFGTFTLALNLILLLIQFIILKKDFKGKHLMQILASFLFSFFLDFHMANLSGLVAANLFVKILVLLAGCSVLALGTAIQVAPDLIMVPGEGIVTTISQVTGQDFGRVKVKLDLSLVSIAIVSSLVFFKRIVGVGLGTLVSALLVGRLVDFFQSRLDFLDRINNLVK